jgi:hypothetical protein
MGRMTRINQQSPSDMTEEIQTEKSDSSAPSGRSASAGSGGFKVVGNYLYAPVESARTFATKAEADAFNRQWVKDAAAQGMRWTGRAVCVKPHTLAKELGYKPSAFKKFNESKAAEGIDP